VTTFVGVLLLAALAVIIFLLYWRVVIPVASLQRAHGRRGLAVSLIVLSVLVLVLALALGWHIGTVSKQ
jgi:hypothetical protein